MIRWRGYAVVAWAALALLGCESTDSGLGVTSNRDFTLALQVPGRFARVGDQVPVTVRLRRTDGTNMPRGSYDPIVVTTSIHGKVDEASVGVSIENETTSEFFRNLVFAAERPGIAEVRVSFQDATAVVEILISRADT